MKKILIMVFAGLTFLILPALVLADVSGGPPASTVSGGPATSHVVTNPLGNNINSICGLIKALLGAAIAIGIPIAVLFIVYAGLQFVLARGNSEALVTARQNFLYTVIGIGIFLGAWLLAMVISSTVNSISQGATGQQAISCQ